MGFMCSSECNKHHFTRPGLYVLVMIRITTFFPGTCVSTGVCCSESGD